MAARVYQPAMLFASFPPVVTRMERFAISFQPSAVGWWRPMHLDVQTLSVVTVFITALLGALLVFAGLQNRSVRAPMWWGAAHIVNASGLALLTSRGVAPDFVTIDLANALVLFGYGLTWTGARVFDGRRSGRSTCCLAPALDCCFAGYRASPTT